MGTVTIAEGNYVYYNENDLLFTFHSYPYFSPKLASVFMNRQRLNPFSIEWKIFQLGIKKSILQNAIL